MSDELDDLLNEVQESDVKIPVGELEVGVLYPIRSLERSNSKVQGKEIPGIICRVTSPESLNLFTYLPKCFVSMKDALYDRINTDGATDSKWSLVFYGSVGNGNICRLVRPGQGVDEELLKKMSSMKRRAENAVLMNNKKMKSD
ncbi:uncharacterized protein LOC117645000 [Thrips palmi]|uniref:Uncharacterized protein LOC117645000 n=1 Tax=Thrips palmi TaxID=161013 RepID=A0A6P8Z2E3_THRPL|nr:uncharacterized protein LOC117645000 [Thrips palmi]